MAKRKRKRKRPKKGGGGASPQASPTQSVAAAQDAVPAPSAATAGPAPHAAATPPAPSASSAPASPVERWWHAFRTEFGTPGAAAFFLAILAVLVYAYSVQVPFLFDDAPVITRNRLLWNWDSLWQLLMTLKTRALTNLTFFVNFQLAHGGVAPMQPYGPADWWSYHVVSIGLHAANGVLLYLLVRALLEAREGEVPPTLAHGTALAGAAIWIVHPANVMAVAYIAQRYALLAACGFLGTLLLYVRLRRRMEAAKDGAFPLPLFLGTLAVSLTCAVTKENVAVIPAAILGVELLIFGGRRWKLAMCFFAVFALGAGLRLSQTGFAHFFPSSSPTSDRWEYLITQVVVQLRYLHLFLLPHDLCAEQSFPILWSSQAAGELGTPLFLWPVQGDWAFEGAGSAFALAILGHLLIGLLATLLFVRGQRFIPLAVGWFYLTNLVESSFIPILDPMVDHRMYLPTALLAPALAVAAARAWPGLTRPRLNAPQGLFPRARTLYPLVGAVAVLAFAGGTLVRIHVWTSATAIWQDTVAKRPHCARAHSSLGMEHLYAGEWLDAVEPIETALMLGPYHVEGWNNLGKAYLELEDWDARRPDPAPGVPINGWRADVLAEQALLRGIEIHKVAPSPSVPLCWNNLGLIYIKRSDRTQDLRVQRAYLEEAMYRLHEATRLDPGYEIAYLNRSTAAFKLLASSQGKDRFTYARETVDALDRAQAVANKRGSDLTLTMYRRRALARAEMGCEPHGPSVGDPAAKSFVCRSGQALHELGQLIEVARTREPRLWRLMVEDAARVALAAANQQDPARGELLNTVAPLLDAALQESRWAGLLRVRGYVAQLRGERDLAIQCFQATLEANPQQPEATRIRQVLDTLQKTNAPPR